MRLLIPFLSIIFFLTGCVSSYFKSPNDVYKTPATIYLDDGTEKSGELTIQFETGFDSERFITLFHKESKQNEKIPASSVKCYKINSNYYFPKEVDLNLNGKYYFLFLKRLTDENSRIHLYELHEDYKTNDVGEDHHLYFISLPTFSKYEVWSANGIKLYPNFEFKMSNLVADCSTLATKIREKDKGYTIPGLASEAKRLEIYKRIVDEYNQCH